MDKFKLKRNKSERRHRRVRAKVRGTAVCPRLSVKRSLRFIFLQLIDDTVGRTLVSVSSQGIETAASNPFKAKTAAAYATGLALAKKALDKKITSICFDRGSYAYHGRVKAAAEGLRAGGLKF